MDAPRRWTVYGDAKHQPRCTTCGLTIFCSDVSLSPPQLCWDCKLRAEHGLPPHPKREG